MQGRIIAFPLIALGLLSILSGALGLGFWDRFFAHGALGLNDLVPGVLFLVIGGVVLRLSSDAPFTDQVRSIRDWSAERWFSFGLTTTGVLLGVAVTAFGWLLPEWQRYAVYGAGALIIFAGALVRQHARDDSARP